MPDTCTPFVFLRQSMIDVKHANPTKNDQISPPCVRACLTRGFRPSLPDDDDGVK